MSEQIEKEILQLLKKQEKTLENQGKRLDKHEDNILKILKNQEKFEKELKSQGEKLDYVSNDLKEQKEKLDYVSNDLKEKGEKLDYVSNDLKEKGEKLDYVSNNLKEQKEKLDYVSNDLRSFSRHFAVFEDNFSRKVDTLFQNYSTDYDEHKIFKKDIDSLKNYSFKHDVQIEHLSKKIANA